MVYVAPRLRHRTHLAWGPVPLVAQVKNVGTEWASSGNGATSLIAGLRGTGQALRGLVDLRYVGITNERWNTGGILLDVRLTAVVGTDELVVEQQLSTGGPLQLRRSTTGRLYLKNVASGATWTSGRTFASNVVRKVELLLHARGGTQGFFRLLVEGVVELEVYAVDLTNGAGADALLQTIKLDNANEDMGDFALYVGNGGFDDGDTRSDAAGNPRVLQLYVNAQGNWAQGTNEGGAPAGDPHYQQVDEQPTSNTTDSVSLPNTDATKKESYQLTDLPGTVTRVLAVSGLYYHKTDTATNTGVPFTRSHGVDGEYREPLDSTYVSSTTFDRYFAGWWSKDFATGAEWTVADVNALELGWRRLNVNDGKHYVSHVVAEVLCYVSPPAAPVVGTAVQSVLRHKAHHLARLWDVIPRWGSPLRFTDHSNAMLVDSRLYVPAGGFSATAQRRETGLKESDVDFAGAITSDAITAADLRAGRYRQARVLERVVDWRYPWAGAVVTTPWTIEDVEFDGEKWTATMSGLQARLQNLVGDSYGRKCRADLFDNDQPGQTPSVEKVCKLASRGYSRGVNVTAVTSRSKFDFALPTGPTVVVGWFDDGIISFATGQNAGVSRQVKAHTAGKLELYLPLPFDLAVLDYATVWPGCNKLIGTVNAGDCKQKFDNVHNYGASPWIPGTAALVYNGLTD